MFSEIKPYRKKNEKLDDVKLGKMSAWPKAVAPFSLHNDWQKINNDTFYQNPFQAEKFSYTHCSVIQLEKKYLVT